MADLPALLERIRALIDDPAAPGSKPGLADIEHTLTDGYARALALEAERWRIERQISELARKLQDPAEARELRRLALRLTAAEDDLTRLRGLLGVLQERAASARSTFEPAT